MADKCIRCGVKWTVHSPAGTDTYSAEQQAESRAEYLRDRYGYEVEVKEVER